MLSLALNFVKEKDKNYILFHIIKHLKLSKKSQQKNAEISCKHKCEVAWLNIFIFAACQ